MILDERSISRLNGVHPDLQAIVRQAAVDTDIEFVVTEGLRTLERQKQLLAAKATQTLKSRHLTGHAVDLAAKVGGEVRWDWPLYNRLAVVMKSAAAKLNLKIEWGGDWRSFKDGPHFQLPESIYPGD